MDVKKCLDGYKTLMEVFWIHIICVFSQRL